jgi:hypothetical protein
MIPEYEVIGKSALVICQKCNTTGKAEPLIVDQRFHVYRCTCGKFNLLPGRLLKGKKNDGRN